MENCQNVGPEDDILAVLPIDLNLKSYSCTECKLSSIHAVDVSDILAISVDQPIIISETNLKKMEEVSSDRSSEHHIPPADAAMRIHSALGHPLLKVTGCSGCLHLGIVEVILDRCS